eukprot:COSAG06_NODE_6494_length_2909_cov_6.102491_6_plen_47_part_00
MAPKRRFFRTVRQVPTLRFRRDRPAVLVVLEVQRLHLLQGIKTRHK